MPGFFSIIKFDKNVEMAMPTYAFGKKIIVDNVNWNSGCVFSDTNLKFDGDKLFFETDQFVVIIEGVIFNKSELISYSGLSWTETIIELYKNFGDTFYKKFRGCFTGLIYCRQEDKWIIFNDPIGDKQLFYYQNKDYLIIGSEIKYLLSCFEANKLSISLNETAAYMLLSYGYMLDDLTLFSEIKKLKPGHNIIVTNKVHISQYYLFNNEANSLLRDEREIIEEIDSRFILAVKRQFNKDIEYGHKHLAGLSGGLDSRMTTWVANNEGYKNIVNFTFSQSDYWDEKTAKLIAGDLKHEWLFKSLDNGLFIQSQLQNIIDINYGMALFYGLAHGKSCLDLIDLTSFGLVHSGQLGDVILGSYLKRKEEVGTLNDYKKGAYSTHLLHKIEPFVEKIYSTYQNNELYRLYTRGFNGINQGLVVSQQKTETFSPFYDLDFMEFSLSIPLELRMNHLIYHKWIKLKYPQAASYHWEKIGANLNSPSIMINGKRLPLSFIRKKILEKVLTQLGGHKMNSLSTKHHMNPLNYWYNTNPELKLFLDNFMSTHIEYLDKYPDLSKDISFLYKIGGNIEKNQVITLLATLKSFFN